MSQIAPRSAGSLTIGEVAYKDGVFSADMIYTANVSVIGEDQVKSATLAVARNFQTLLHRNGFWTHSTPEVRMTPLDKKTVHFLMACEAALGTPTPIRVETISREDADEG